MFWSGGITLLHGRKFVPANSVAGYSLADKRRERVEKARPIDLSPVVCSAHIAILINMRNTRTVPYTYVGTPMMMTITTPGVTFG